MTPSESKHKLISLKQDLYNLQQGMFEFNDRYSNCRNQLGTVIAFMRKVIEELDFHIITEEARLRQAMEKKNED